MPPSGPGPQGSHLQGAEKGQRDAVFMWLQEPLCGSVPTVSHLPPWTVAKEKALLWWEHPPPLPPHIAPALSGEALGRLQGGLPSITSGCQTRRPPPSEPPPLGSLQGGGLQDQLLGRCALSSPSPLIEGTLPHPRSRTIHWKSIH